MLLANFNRKEHLRHRAVSLRQHGFLVSVTAGADASDPGDEGDQSAGDGTQQVRRADRRSLEVGSTFCRTEGRVRLRLRRLRLRILQPVFLERAATAERHGRFLLRYHTESELV